MANKYTSNCGSTTLWLRVSKSAILPATHRDSYKTSQYNTLRETGFYSLPSAPQPSVHSNVPPNYTTGNMPSMKAFNHFNKIFTEHDV